LALEQIPALLLKTGVFFWLFVWTIVDVFYPLRLRSFFVSPLGVISGKEKVLRGITGNNTIKASPPNVFSKVIDYFCDKFQKSKSGCLSSEVVPFYCPAIKMYGLCNNSASSHPTGSTAIPVALKEYFDTGEYTKCPIFINLNDYINHVKDNPKDICYSIGQINDMWNIIRRSCVVRYQQVAFIEMVILQVFLVVFWPNLFGSTLPKTSGILPNDLLLYLDYLFVIGIVLLIVVFIISFVETKPISFYENKLSRFILIIGCWFIMILYILNQPSM
jgi:hypothetical protein